MIHEQQTEQSVQKVWVEEHPASEDGTKDSADIQLYGRYPEGVAYSVFNAGRAVVEIVSGQGYLQLLRPNGFMSQVAIKAGDKDIPIPQGQPYAWYTEATDRESGLHMVMENYPPFAKSGYTQVDRYEYIEAHRKDVE